MFFEKKVTIFKKNPDLQMGPNEVSRYLKIGPDNVAF